MSGVRRSRSWPRPTARIPARSTTTSWPPPPTTRVREVPTGAGRCPRAARKKAGMRSSARAGRREERGVALLLVLWIFVILGVLAMDFARYIRDDAMAAVNFSEETRAYYLALAGMNRTIFDADRARERAAPGAIAQPLDADHLKRAHGAESEFYLERRPSYRAKNGFFDSPEELLLVRGVTPALFYGHDGIPGLREVFSVYSRSNNIHLRNASPAVLQALLGLDADTAADLVAQRDTDSTSFFQQITTQVSDPHLVQLMVEEEPRTVLLEGRADTQAQRNQSAVAAVVDLSSESAEGARVLRWLDRAPWSGAIVPGSPAVQG